MITNVVDEMVWWSCFREPGNTNRFEDEEDSFKTLVGEVDKRGRSGELNSR